jgi:N-formylmaleamate deformylase
MSFNWDPHSITANGVNFNYYRTPGAKDPGKPALILQHGFSDNGLCWAPVAEELAADYDIIMPDARGHGLSARVERNQHIDQAADLAALMGALNVPKAVVAGHSMGAMIATDLAARFPELVSAMFLEDPGWFIPRPGAPRFGSGSMEESPLGKWMIGLKDKSLDEIMAECHLEHPTWPEAYVQPWCQGKKELDLNFLSAEHRAEDWQASLPKIKCPLLLITADPEQGSIVTLETVNLAKEMKPDLRVVNFPRVGHHVRFAVHQAYMQSVKAFLDEAA